MQIYVCLSGIRAVCQCTKIYLKKVDLSKKKKSIEIKFPILNNYYSETIKEKKKKNKWHE